MSTVTIWAGPIFDGQRALSWPHSRVVSVDCAYDANAGKKICGGLDAVAGDASDVYLAAFGRGAQIVMRWLPDSRVRGIYLADPHADDLRALVDWVARAGERPKLRAVFTASSSPSGGPLTGSQELAAIALAAGQRGTSWSTSPIAGVDLKAAHTWSAGGAFLLDLGSSVTPLEHATQVAPMLWSKLFVPPTNPYGGLGASPGSTWEGAPAGGSGASAPAVPTVPTGASAPAAPTGSVPTGASAPTTGTETASFWVKNRRGLLIGAGVVGGGLVIAGVVGLATQNKPQEPEAWSKRFGRGEEDKKEGGPT